MPPLMTLTAVEYTDTYMCLETSYSNFKLEVEEHTCLSINKQKMLSSGFCRETNLQNKAMALSPRH